MSSSLPRWKLYLLMISLVAVGSIGVSFLRLQGKQTVDGDKWQHPWFQAFGMFIGECLCLIYYYFQMRTEKQKYGTSGLNPNVIEARRLGLKTKINPLLFAIPATWDWAASGMMSYAFLNLPTSVAEMMGGTLILLATVSTVIFLGKRYFLYQWWSLILIIGGVVMVGASSIANNTDSSENPVFGIILIMFAFWIQATQMIVEEKLFRNYLLSPFKVIGMEGVFGLIISSVFLFIAYFIHWSNDLWFDGKLEDAPKAFVDLFKNGYLLFLFIGFVLTMGLYNALGVSVTKYASSSNRTTINTSKVVVLWLFFLLYPGEGGETFHWLQFGGFIPIVIGTFIFNAQDSKKTKQNIISEENNDLSSKLNGSDECS